MTIAMCMHERGFVDVWWSPKHSISFLHFENASDRVKNEGYWDIADKWMNDVSLKDMIEWKKAADPIFRQFTDRWSILLPSVHPSIN